MSIFQRLISYLEKLGVEMGSLLIWGLLLLGQINLSVRRERELIHRLRMYLRHTLKMTQLEPRIVLLKTR